MYMSCVIDVIANSFRIRLLGLGPFKVWYLSKSTMSRVWMWKHCLVDEKDESKAKCNCVI